MKRIITQLMAFLLFGIGAWNQGYGFYSFDGTNANNFYVEFLGGANFLHIDKGRSCGGVLDISRYSSRGDGYILTGYLGYRFCNGWRFEAEYSYRRNPVSRSIGLLGVNQKSHSSIETSSYMFNLILEPLVGLCCDLWGIVPYVGAGIGYDWQEVNKNRCGLLDSLSSSNVSISSSLRHHRFRRRQDFFSWQFFAGAEYPFLCNTALSLEYKFHKGPHEFNQSISVGIIYKFLFSNY